tara:strand:+ start:15 stop:167 length:153 start_codon:yes stop_codon:yes gene_type:complete
MALDYGTHGSTRLDPVEAHRVAATMPVNHVELVTNTPPPYAQQVMGFVAP